MKRRQRVKMILNRILRAKPKGCQAEKGVCQCEYSSEGKMVVIFPRYLLSEIVCLLLCLLSLQDLLSS